MAVGETPPTDPTPLTTQQLMRVVGSERDYVDGQIAVLEQRLASMDRATQVLHERTTQFPTDVQLAVGHLQELTNEKFDGLTAVLDEQRRAKMVEEQEREKAAAALRMELSRAIAEGDNNLRDHIAAQVSQINAALESAELLEVQRVGALEKQAAVTVQTATERLASLQREATIVSESSEAAISKAERSAEKQFDEFSKTVQAQITALRETVQDLIRRLDKLA